MLSHQMTTSSHTVKTIKHPTDSRRSAQLYHYPAIKRPYVVALFLYSDKHPPLIEAHHQFTSEKQANRFITKNFLN